MDRNRQLLVLPAQNARSLSARRAWIEILYHLSACNRQLSLSARRAWIEILVCVKPFPLVKRSLSARRAWIEIKAGISLDNSTQLSLSARRAWIEIPDYSIYPQFPFGRSPQGERG